MKAAARLFLTLALLLFQQSGALAFLGSGQIAALVVPMDPARHLYGDADMNFSQQLCWAKLGGYQQCANYVPNTRAGSESCTDAYGKIWTAPGTVNCISTGVGLPPWQASTNLVLQSQTMATTSWSNSNSTPLNAQTTAPDGTNTGVQVTDNSTSGPHSIFGSNFTTTTSQSYTASIYLKGGTLRYVSFRSEASASGPIYPWLTLDTQTGVITNNGAANATFAASATYAGNGWWRVWITFTAIGNSGNGNIVVAGSTSSAAPLTTTVTGSTYSGSGQTFFVWGAQVEALAFPTPYIPTTTSTATRAADNITAQGALLTAILNAKAARFVTNGMVGGSNPAVLQWPTSPTTIFYSSTSAIRIQNGANLASATLGSGSTATLVKSAFGFDASGMSAIANGSAKATNANAPITTGTVTIGSGTGAGWLNGNILRMTFGPTKGMFDGLTANAGQL